MGLGVGMDKERREMKRFLWLLVPLLLQAKEVDMLKNAEVFIVEMTNTYGFKKPLLEKLFSQTTFKATTLNIYNIPFKAYKNDASWRRYKKHIITDKKINDAKKFLQRYHDTLEKAENIYKVPKEYIAAFIGVESNFGRFKGKHNILDSLATLAFFENRKQDFFRFELEHFLLMCRDKGINPLTQTGSFAGAMGCVQQLPSVHHLYGVDFDGDGDKNLFSMQDCIGTIANFMHANGWENDALVTMQASYGAKRYEGLVTGYDKIYTIETLKESGIVPVQFFPQTKASLLQIRDTNHDELWLGAHNFRVLTAYNNSTNYAMAIHQIAQRLMYLKQKH